MGDQGVLARAVMAAALERMEDLLQESGIQLLKSERG